MLSLVAEFSANLLASYFGEKLIDNVFANGEGLVEELREVIDATIQEYQERFPADTGRLLPFYHSKELVGELLKFRVMAPEKFDLGALHAVLESEPGVMAPSAKELSDFFGIFMAHVNGNDRLSSLEVREDFREEIFAISRRISGFGNQLDQLVKTYNGDLEQQWRNRLDTYVEQIRAFRPLTALRLLESLEESFGLASQRPTKPFLAFLTFQKGICNGLLDRTDEAYRMYLKAYALDGGKILFAERALLAYFHFGESKVIEKLLGEVLSMDPLNPTAWAIDLLNHPFDEFESYLGQVPSVVRKDFTFQRVVYQLAERHEFSFAEMLMANGIFAATGSESGADFVLTTDNLKEALYLVNVFLMRALGKYHFNFQKTNSEQDAAFRGMNRLLREILPPLRSSEVVLQYELLEFLLAFTSFYMTRQEEHAIEMELRYRRMDVRDMIYAINCLDALLLVDRLDLVGPFVEDFDFQEAEYLLIKLEYYQRTKEEAAYVETAIQFFAALPEIGYEWLKIVVNQLLDVGLMGILEKVPVAELLADKIFEQEGYRDLVSLVLSLLSGTSSEPEINALAEFAQSSDDGILVNLIGSAFYIAGRNREAIDIFSLHVDSSEPYRELYHYINALYRSKESQHEMLVLLKEWRQEHKFNRFLLGMEAEIRRYLMEWEEIIAICEYCFTVHPNDEVMLLHYLKSLHATGKGEDRRKIGDMAERLRDFVFTDQRHAGWVARLLMRLGYVREGFDLLYVYAADPSNISARTAFIFMAMQYGDVDENIFLAYEIAEENCWIEYRYQGKRLFVELDAVAREHRLFGLFFGKRMGDEVRLKRLFGNVEDTVSIERVMNKFLALHVQIMVQAEDPFSGLPIQPFQLDPSNPANSLVTMLKSFGAKSGLVEAPSWESDVAKYYGGEFSLSELASRRFNSIKDAYYTLATQEKGILAQPLPWYRGSAARDAVFVLDHSSLLFLFQVHRIHGLVYPHRFMISRYIVEFIREQLGEARERREQPKARAMVHEGNFKVEALEDVLRGHREHLEALAVFIEAYTEPVLSERTLDFIRNAGLVLGENHVLDAAMSTVLIVEDHEGSFLITDDLVYRNFRMQSPAMQCSTEYYMKLVFGGTDLSLYEFIRNRFINYSPEAWQLDAEFAKQLSGQPSHYENCLANLSLANGSGNLKTAIAHLREVVMSAVLIERDMLRYATEVLVNLLRGANADLLPLVRDRLLASFRLLGNKLDLVLQAFADALDIIFGDDENGSNLIVTI